MTTRNSVAVWFEIPAADFDRATAFYEALFGVAMRRESIGPNRLAVFPYEEGAGISGCILESSQVQPSAQGSLVYLNCDGRLDSMLGRVEDLGGRRMGPVVTLPGDMGRFAHVIDTEGNRVGLHAVT